MFISKKRYNDLLDSLNESERKIVDLEGLLEAAQIELNKQTAVNHELTEFSEKFREFYKKVTSIPVLVKDQRNITTVSGSIFLDEREVSYGDVVLHMKSQLVHDLVKRIESLGLVKFDLDKDPVTGRTVYKACLNIVKE